MTRPNRPLFLFFFLLLSLPTLAAAQDARQDILQADDRRFAAMVQGDLATLGGLLTEDMTYTHSSGQIETKTQLLETLRTGKIRYFSAEPADREVRLYGDTAVVTGRAAVRASIQGGPETLLPLRFTEVWVKSGGAWKLAAWQSTRVAG